MKNTSVAFIAVFLLLCLAPSLGMLVFGPAQASANEILAAEPEPVNGDGGVNMEYLPQLAGYVSDRFWLRQELITLGRKLQSAVFSSSGEDSVILGQDGWLFYASTLGDYTGVEGLTERELFAASRNLYLMNEYCRSIGVDFLFTAAPNKNSLYGAYMPATGQVAETHDAQRLYALLSAWNVPYLDLFEVFNAETETLYFAHDSHWTSRGAALAADSINAAFGIESGYFSGAFSPQAHSGDLYEMLYPAGHDGEQDLVYTPAIQISYGSGGGTRPDSVTINTTGSGEGVLLACRDSFGNNLYPYLADSFAAARFSRSTTYDLTLLSGLQADCLLIELVERNLGYLLDYTPVLPCPERELPLPERRSGTLPITVGSGSASGLTLCQGSLPLDIDADSPVYIVCEGQTFEALLGRRGFSAWLPEGSQPQLVLLYSQGELCALNAEIR